MKKACYTPQNHELVLKVIEALEKFTPARCPEQPADTAVRGLEKTGRRISRIIGFERQKQRLQEYLQDEINYLYYYSDNNDSLKRLTAQHAAMTQNDPGFGPAEQEVLFDERDEVAEACRGALNYALKIHEQALELIYEIEVRFARQPILF